MSLLKKIYEAKEAERAARPAFAGSLGYNKPDKWNLATTDYATREEVEHAYDQTRPIYDTIIAEQTWPQKHGDATIVSFRHHIWVDEKEDGSFALCVSFDNPLQTNDFVQKAEEELKTNEFKKDFFNLSYEQSDPINTYMGATHTVEVDVVGVSTAQKLWENFEDAARPTALYSDKINKNDGPRLKAYFADEAAAYEFAGRIRNVEYRVRSFPAAKPTQPKRPNIA